MSTIGQNMVGGPNDPNERRARRVKNRQVGTRLEDWQIAVLVVGAILLGGGALVLLAIFAAALAVRLGLGL